MRFLSRPSIFSHARAGGHIRAALAQAGTALLLVPRIFKSAIFIVVSPILGITLGLLNMVALSWIFCRCTPRRVDRWFRRSQLVSPALYSLGHGSHGAQKTMGIIWPPLIAAGITSKEHLPLWVIVSCYAAIALGMLCGGWRIAAARGLTVPAAAWGAAGASRAGRFFL